MKDAYAEQARGLLDGGCDLLLVETIFDTLNAKAAIVAIEEVFEARGRRVPVMISVTITDQSGRTLSGQTVEAFWVVDRPRAARSRSGINCALGAREMRPYLADLAGVATCCVSCYPNAGLPNAFGQYDETPAETARLLKEFVAEGLVDVVGGCCGTTPDHIRAIAAEVASRARRAGRRPGPEGADRQSTYAGLEPFTIRPDSNFTMIGERTNVSGSARFRRLIKDGNLADARGRRARPGARRREPHRRQHGRGPARLRARDDGIPAPRRDRARDCPRAGDDRQLEVVGHRGRAPGHPGQAGRQLDQPQGGRSGLPPQGAARPPLRRGRRRHGVRRGRPGRHRRAEGADPPARLRPAHARGRLRRRTTSSSIPNVLAIGTGLEEHANYAVDFIEATRILKATCPGARVSGGISNLSFAFRGNDAVREAIHAVFLYHAIAAGLDMGIVNAGQLVVYEDIPADLRERVEDLVFNRRPDATERLVQFAGIGEGRGPAARRRPRVAGQRTVEARLAPRAGARRRGLHRGRRRGGARDAGRSRSPSSKGR